MTDVHYLHRPTLVHALKERAGNTYTARCGVTTEDSSTVSGWSTKVTCDDCSPVGDRAVRAGS